jgi:hypothetical protein
MSEEARTRLIDNIAGGLAAVSRPDVGERSTTTSARPTSSTDAD